MKEKTPVNSDTIAVELSPETSAAPLPVTTSAIPAETVQPPKLIETITVPKGGRPAGAKTRADSPRLIAYKAKLIREGKAIPEHLRDTPVAPDVAQQFNQTMADTQIFGDQPEPQPSANPNTENPNPGAESAKNATPPPEPEKTKPADPSAYIEMAGMIWDTIIAFLVGIMGRFWLPRPMGSDAAKGQIPYDERNLVVSSFAKYLASISSAVITPLQEFCCAIFLYCAPRINEIVIWFKAKTAKPTQTVADSRNPSGASQAAKPQTAQPPTNAPLDACV